MEHIELREITRDNWRACARLSVREDQTHFVAPNAYSLAEAHYEQDLWPLAIYTSEGTLVGFAMYGWEPENERWWVVRLMTDQHYQGRGYGRAAMLGLLDIMEKARPGKEIAISYEPENDVARKLYASLGFVETGEIEQGEVIAVKR